MAHPEGPHMHYEVVANGKVHIFADPTAAEVFAEQNNGTYDRRSELYRHKVTSDHDFIPEMGPPDKVVMH